MTWLSSAHSGSDPAVQALPTLTTSATCPAGTVYSFLSTCDVPGARDATVPISPMTLSVTVMFSRVVSPVLVTVNS